MPYICLTQNIPDGTVQITDLLPNVSTRNATTDGPGQNRYVNRVQNEDVRFGSKTANAAKGLKAYLLDRVVPGGNAAPSLTVTLNAPQAGAELNLYGVVFAYNAAPTITSQEWSDATSLAAAINHATAQALFEAAFDTGHWLTAAVVGPDVVVSANTTATVIPNAYPALDVSASPTGEVDVSSDRVLLTGGGKWSHANVTTAASNLIARCDAGQSLMVSDVNTVLAAVVANTALGTQAGGNSSLSEILSILSGREFYLPAGSEVYNSSDVKVSNHGSFTRANVQNGTIMVNGEYRPSTIGGDVVQVERKPVRPTVQSSSFQLSLVGGVLKHFTEGVTLFPDSDVVPPTPWTYQSNSALVNLTNRRLVTVYDDDGSLLA